jgi:hypothetical protein
MPFTTRLRRILTGTIAAAALALVAAPQAMAAGWQYWEVDGDRCYDASTLDANGNGNAEQHWFDLDNDCRWDTNLYNTRGWDGFLEEATYDMNENGAPEYLIQDMNQRVGFEWVYLDRNQDRVYEQRRIIPGSDLDAITRTTTNMANNAILHQFTMRTGQSLLFPSFPTP